jgi:hypothetical protein
MTSTRTLPEKTDRPARATFSYAPLYWLALGAFAVGTEGFMIAAILPRIGKERLFPFLNLRRSDLAELDRVDFSQPFGLAGAIIEFRRLTRKTEKIGNDLPKRSRVAFYGEDFWVGSQIA